MEWMSLRAPLPSLTAAERTGSAADWAIVVFGAFLFWICESRPSLMPVWAPWDFSPLIYLATTLTLLWFFRGVVLTPPQERPPVWRRAVFVIGLLTTYAVLQTRFEYWSQHMFFLNRIQHVVDASSGPLPDRARLALAARSSAACRAAARLLVESRFASGADPGGAAARCSRRSCSSGLFYFWLIPAVHFRAMIDARLYALMNWSMVLDGILFWWSGVSTRGRARRRGCRIGVRAALAHRRHVPADRCSARSIAFSSRPTSTLITICAAGCSPRSARSTTSSSEAS